MRRSVAFVLFSVWLLTTGSSCQTTAQGSNFHFESSGAASAAGIGVFLVAAGIYCLANTENCFPDEEKLQARAASYAQAQATFTAGLRRYREGDPTGIESICLSAHRGYANAQYFYGTHLFKQGPTRTAEGVAWLRRAAMQGHREADILIRQVNGWVGPAGPESAVAPVSVGPPTFMACTGEGS